MPLSATVGEIRIESWAVSAADWLALKASYRKSGVIMSCGQNGIPKTSRLGTQFFAHRPNSECAAHDGAPETAIHLRAKAIVAQAAQDVGWDATVEYAAPDRSWIADVLLEKDGRRLAVEIQWSPQSDVDFRRRQDRYEAAGIECIWLVPKRNVQGAETSLVPHHLLSGTEDDLKLAVPFHPFADRPLAPLLDAVKLLLDGSIVNRMEAIISGVQVDAKMRQCWQKDCGKWLTLWYVSTVILESRCDRHSAIAILNGYPQWQPQRIEGSVQVAVRNHLAQLKLAAPVVYDRRYSKIMQVFYQGQICPHCNVVQGDGLIGSTWDWDEYFVPVRQSQHFDESVLAAPHLCTDRGNGRCSQTVLPGPGFPAEDLPTIAYESNGLPEE
jgi:hypothetical protein